MKLFKLALVSAMLSTSAFAQDLDLATDKITDSVPELSRMTVEQIKAEKRTFVDFITKYRSSEFIGETQYAFSPLNLSIRTDVKYSIETNGSIMFQMATDGNRHIDYRSDVTFPTQGLVYFELRNSDSVPLEFLSPENDKLNFLGTRNTFYIVETESSFKTRRDVQAKYNKEGRALGRYLAITKYDMFTQEIEFYEMIKAEGGTKLVRRGSYFGSVPEARRRR